VALAQTLAMAALTHAAAASVSRVPTVRSTNPAITTRVSTELHARQMEIVSLVYAPLSIPEHFVRLVRVVSYFISNIK